MMEKEEKKKDKVKNDEMNTASTGLIGTALYVAPELEGATSKQDKKPRFVDLKIDESLKDLFVIIERCMEVELISTV